MSRVGYPSDKQDQFVLRLPDGMRGEIKSAADRNGRSMNSEIIARLQSTFNNGGDADVVTLLRQALAKLEAGE